MLFTSLIVKVLMIGTLEKLSVTYVQEQKNMLLVIKSKLYVDVYSKFLGYKKIPLFGLAFLLYVLSKF